MKVRRQIGTRGDIPQSRDPAIVNGTNRRYLRERCSDWPNRHIPRIPIHYRGFNRVKLDMLGTIHEADNSRWWNCLELSPV